MGGMTWRLGLALLIGLSGVLMGCSKITVIRTQELRILQEQIQASRKEIADVQKAVDDLSLNQGGTTSKMRADLTSMLSELQNQISRLQEEIDETQSRLGQLSLKLDKLDQRKVVFSNPPPGDTTVGAATKVKVVEGLDFENLFNQSSEDFIRGKYELAQQGFKTVFDKDTVGTYKDQALFWIAECLVKLDKGEKAMETYAKVIKDFPKGNKSCSSRFKMGLIYDQKKDITHRNEIWNQLISSCPQSNEAHRAKEMMHQ